MSWLTDVVRPKIRSLVRKNDIPDHLWHKCPKCEQMIFHRDLQENLQVCRHCHYHMRLSAKERLNMLFDSAMYTCLSWPEVPLDPLHFKDSKRYTDRLKDARLKTKLEDAILVGSGKIGGKDVIIAAFDFGFIGGSMGMAVGEALIRGAEAACAHKSPFVVIPASGGARMQEGILSLMQMPRSVLALSMVKEKGLPYVTVLTNPTTGGVAASFAALGDIILAEPEAIIGFTGARVIQETLRTPLPEGFQSSEFQLDHGFVDCIVHRHELRSKLTLLFNLLMGEKKFSSPLKERSRALLLSELPLENF